MYWFYNLALLLTSFFLDFLARFNPKIRLFTQGRKHTFVQLAASFRSEDRIIWVHAASLGEFEQGLPVIRQIRETYPTHKILLTFFSPSGYEVKKESREVDFVSYLPIDTKANAVRFLNIISPELALFVKYEIWPNYYRELNKRNIPLLLISALFKKQQVYFKWYGGFMRQALRVPAHIFVQDETSLNLLNSIGIKKASVSGDTRFDRVSEILNRDNSLSFMETFKNGALCLVCGSTWPEDEILITDYINNSPHPLKYVLAPHDIKSAHIRKLKDSINKKVLLYSELEDRELNGIQVLLIDTIGLLTKIYSYADFAYVGGGFVTGLHNTLEPAVFGIPVVIGPNYERFREAVDLVRKAGLLVVEDRQEFTDIMNKLVTNPDFRRQTGQINASYISEQQGASIQIMAHIRNLVNQKIKDHDS